MSDKIRLNRNRLSDTYDAGQNYTAHEFECGCQTASFKALIEDTLTAKREPNRNPSMCGEDTTTSSVEVEVQLAHNKGFPYYGCMNITLSLDEKIVKEVRKIAVERDTTLTGLVREYLQKLAAESAATGRKRRELERLEKSFDKYHFSIGKRTWKRADLYDRS